MKLLCATTVGSHFQTICSIEQELRKKGLQLDIVLVYITGFSSGDLQIGLSTAQPNAILMET